MMTSDIEHGERVRAEIVRQIQLLMTRGFTPTEIQLREDQYEAFYCAMRDRLNAVPRRVQEGEVTASGWEITRFCGYPIKRVLRAEHSIMVLADVSSPTPAA